MKDTGTSSTPGVMYYDKIASAIVSEVARRAHQETKQTVALCLCDAVGNLRRIDLLNAGLSLLRPVSRLLRIHRENLVLHGA